MENAIQQITFGEIQYRSGSFERLIAKAAYCHAVYRYGLDGIKDKLVLPIILGQDAEYNKYVGMENTNAVQINAGPLHTTNTVILDNGLILGYVHLFCVYAAPVYTVVVGRKS